MQTQKTKVSVQLPPIVERPDLQNRSQRWGYRSVTVVCWILWLYLFVPVLSFIAWVLGLSVIYQVLLQGLDLDQLWHLLHNYAIGIGLFTGTYLLWALYSLIRFRGRERRVRAPLVADDVLAAAHHLSPAEMSELKLMKNSTVTSNMLDKMFEEHR